jgi:spore coat polysaccharide biosynthesis protein SpsF
MEIVASSVRTSAIIQARMDSTRLPGKVLINIHDRPMLEWVVTRTQQASAVDTVIVATTQNSSDDAIAEFCDEHGFLYYRGDTHDVLDRYYQAAKLFQGDVIVRVTGDCPVIDPSVIDQTVAGFWGRANWQNSTVQGQRYLPAYDFATNRLPPPWGRTFPIGLDTEVCSFTGLEQAWQEATLQYHREHVMPFFYDQPERFKIKLINHDVDYGSLRWTVDTPEDLRLLREIVGHFNGQEYFTWLDVLKAVEQHPEWTQINATVSAKDYRTVDQRRAEGQD